MPSPGVGVGVRVCLARRLWAVALGSHRRTVLRKGWGRKSTSAEKAKKLRFAIVIELLLNIKQQVDIGFNRFNLVLPKLQRYAAAMSSIGHAAVHQQCVRGGALVQGLGALWACRRWRLGIQAHVSGR